MIYFMYAIASIIIFNLLVLAFIVWKFGIDVFFDKDEETTKHAIISVYEIYWK